MQYINIENIKIDENQPRKNFDDEELNNLATSMHKLGKILQPIIIDKDNKIIDGERRYRAAKIAGISQIPYFLINDIPSNQIELVQLVANSNRTNLSGLELARSIKNILDLDVIKKQDIAKLLNKQPSYVTRLISMLSDEWLPLIEQGIITSPNALEALKSLPKEQQEKLINDAKNNNTAITQKSIKSEKAKNINTADLAPKVNHNQIKIKVNKKSLRDIVDYINDNEEIEILLSEKLADEIKILIES